MLRFISLFKKLFCKFENRWSKVRENLVTLRQDDGAQSVLHLGEPYQSLFELSAAGKYPSYTISHTIF